ncbi:MAG: type VI secretion system-associated FHA domain protein [Rubrivivax sp.]
MFKLKIVGGHESAAGAATEFRLPAPPCKVVLGRDPRAEWHLPDKTLALSARHCEVVVGEGWAMLRDISTNGTYVNGANTRMSHDHALNPGDLFEVGPYRIEVLPDGPPVEPPVVVDVALEPPALPPAASRRAKAVFRMRAGEPVPTAEESGADMVTMVRPSTRPTPLEPLAAPAPVAAAPAAPAPAETDALLAALAAGLGLDPAQLAGQDAAETARRTAALARAAVIALRRLLEQEARARRRLGSRQATPQPARDGNPLRVARTPEDALMRLLEAGPEGQAALRRAGDDLAHHQEHMMVCFAGAARRLADDLDPARLEAGVGNAAGPEGSQLRHARLWELYGVLWQSLGQEPGEPWARGFIDAAMLHLASAYDEGSPEGDATRMAGPVR